MGPKWNEVDLIGLNETEVDLIGLNRNCLIFRENKLYIILQLQKNLFISKHGVGLRLVYYRS